MNQTITQDGLATYKSGKPDVMKVKIGKDSEPELYPCMEMEKWDGECMLSLSLPNAGKTKDVLHEPKKLTWKSQKEVVEFKPLDDGFAFDIVLDKKPKTNTFTLDLDTKGIVFEHQPYLTDEEKIARLINRPKNSQGSYAIYHKSKMHGKYGPGKFGHAYTPIATDALGRYVRSPDLEIVPNLSGETSHIMSFSFDEKFFKKAAYPVTIDPDMGFNTAGTSSTLVGVASNLFAIEVPAGYYGYGKEWHWYGKQTRDSAFNVYGDGASEDTYRLCESIVQNVGEGAGWHTVAFKSDPRKPYFKGNTIYSLAIQSDEVGGKTPAGTTIYYDVLGLPQYALKYEVKTWANPPSWSIASGWDATGSYRRWSVYIDIVERRRRMH